MPEAPLHSAAPHLREAPHVPEAPRSDVLIVGAGPAGIAAACSARACGKSVAILDDNPRPGGQIWRGGADHAKTRAARAWFDRFAACGATLHSGARIVAAPRPGLLLCETPDGPRAFPYDKLILATGARELFVPFPGWTLPGVLGAGALQALTKSGLDVSGKRIVIAGSGPLLLAVAAHLRQAGAVIPLIAEQAPQSRILRFAAGLLASPSRLAQAVRLKLDLGLTPYRTSSWPVSAAAEGQRRRITLQMAGAQRSETCDYLACAFGLIPSTELAAMLGCRISNGAVLVDDSLQTSVRGVYAAGELTGVGGVDKAVLEGQIAGFAAADQADRARRLSRQRRTSAAYAASLASTFALNPALRQLAAPDTLVCRCEDVTYAALEDKASGRDAKLHTRCGMGACQGRICSGATHFLFGWSDASIRPPVFPTSLGTLAAPLPPQPGSAGANLTP